ncbi:MAG TPA: alkaline phosphatase D family protein [Streptosporangiaceae bacterium]|nr:alkaline phosphatase D family protein [Streptosporangiaceae bacterium]
MRRLVLGPLLRHVGERTATVWVETDAPGEVTVLGTTSRTFTVHGHHYALVDVEGLTPGAGTRYDVRLDGEVVWPEPATETSSAHFPASSIRTLDLGAPLRVAFGSCRKAPASAQTHGMDALSAYARRLAAGDEDPPSVLLLIGDQVYADEPPPRLRRFVRSRRNVAAPPHEEVYDFDEYAELYRMAWTEDPAVRWLLSTVPTFMIFDDHDIRDDWNTSDTWRRQMAAQPWWRRRIVSGLGSYWIYQHLGNLGPAERDADAVYSAVRAAADGPGHDAGQILDEFAERVDAHPESARWSYALDLGRTRLLTLDSRCARVLERDRRAMLDDPERAWFDEHCKGGVDHLLIASSLPYLLPAAIHDVEAWNEAVCAGAWGRAFARLGERVRQATDLEHWAAFQESFREVAASLMETVRGERGDPPASVTILSGDVHYSYLARVRGGPIAQAVCSPLRHPLAGRLRQANRFACLRSVRLPFRWLARSAGVTPGPLDWRLTDGPWFDNAIATVDIDGRAASVRWETPSAEGMTELGRAVLSPPAAVPRP